MGAAAESIKANTLYRLAPRPLREGGYAVIWAAQKRDTGEEVALKRVKLGAEAAARIKREIIAQQGLAPHPNIMPIFDHDPGYSWYTMPIAHGNMEDLREELDEDALASILSNLADALEFAHARNLIHRDISPRNILALPGSKSTAYRWVVADWGMVSRPEGSSLPQVTRAGDGMGTPGFEAPELAISPSTVTGAADIYSLGRVAAWFLTRQWPTSGHTLLPDGATLRWRIFVKACTEQRVEDRINSIGVFKTTLNEVFTDYEVPPAELAQKLIGRLLAGEAECLDEIVTIARAHLDDAIVYLDYFSQIPSSILRTWTQTSPEQASEAGIQMATFLLSDSWQDRDHEYANTPLGFVHTILQALVDNGSLGLAQDVAAKFFAADAFWKLPLQRTRSMNWIASLGPPADAAIAPVINNSELIEYYAGITPRSAVLARILQS